MKTTPERIESLEPHQVFVFGSNKGGRHLGGAAAVAVEKFGAIMGKGYGLQGQSYAIATLDHDFRKVPLDDLAHQVLRFICFAAARPDLVFLVTPIGCGIAGFTVEEIAPLFLSHALPVNVILPLAFWETTPKGDE